MKVLSATTVATITLYASDHVLWAGRYSDVLVDVLRQVGLLVGLHA